MPSIIQCDVAIVGGGLAGGLIALALRTKRPDVDIRLIEPGAIGGAHVWSFFSSDVTDADRWLPAPLVSHGWRGYEVAFPAYRRALKAGYYSIESERFARVVGTSLAPGQLLAERAIGVGAGAVVLASGDRVEARGVIDARGVADMSMLDLGWQKFVGRELVLTKAHGVERPTVMDATVEQIDGYRFVYCLPFGEKRMFVEDTYYSDTPDIDRAALTERIDAYAAAKGWQVESIAREEAGALPVAIGGDFDAFWRGGGAKTPKAGLRAGLFHPTTGYSLPDAIRLAVAVSRAGDLSTPALLDLTHGMAKRAWAERGFYRMLDAMLFRAAEPDERYRILERFYRLNPGLIGRFYAGRSTMMDKARILSGRPPVPVGRALAAIRGRA
ncbi:MAG: lycopene beta-cyclase CrtY [Sphingomonas sp.]|uniref:lycopene beta-cyclase CrtY n=1 Tax=Sphingomonas sp. TaxID=28214 RepID=UPI0011FAC0A7|nr:lycopene beta-cyclase CrtY [Sphingomonas sp.]THD36147.1 MAG: lycopene beta-cyclase CrtY [Sphingomonas sp.]